MRAVAVLADTMIVIEAVDTGCWNALSGQCRMVTSEACAAELRRGRTRTDASYVPVSEDAISRAEVRKVPLDVRVAFELRYPDAQRLDAGERELLAIAFGLSEDFRLCSCDKAAIAASRSMGMLDRVVSLEWLAKSVGARPRRAFRRQFTEKFLGECRTGLLLG